MRHGPRRYSKFVHTLCLRYYVFVKGMMVLSCKDIADASAVPLQVDGCS